MPNHVCNTLTAFGPPEAVAELVAAARGKPGCWDDPDGEKPFSMDALVPVPRRPLTAAERAQRASLLGDPDAPDTCTVDDQRAVWGVKWGAYAEHDDVDAVTAEVDPGCVTFQFVAAWGPPTDLLETLGMRWPALTFLLSYGGEGPTAGRLRVAGGRPPETHDTEYSKADYPQLADDAGEAEEDAWYAAHREVEQRFRRDHPRWVALSVLAAAGRPFKPDAPPPIVADALDDLDAYGRLAARLRTLAVPPQPALYPD